jgi:chromosome segregation ATPase
MAQRNLHNELKQGDSSTKDLNSIIGRLSHELDTSNAQLKNVTSEKAKLEIRISEMEVLLHRKETMPPLPPKRVGGRPRASSLTHLNVASMEKDLESIRASSKSYQVELESTKAKMSRMQDDLVKVENAKLVLEKQLAESEARLRTALEESEERQRELSYLQVQSGSAEREEQLLARLEEEEKKVELLTSELSAASRSKGGELKRSMERLQTQLNAESSKVARLEEQEIQLTQEREEALNERDDALAKAEELSSLVAEKARAVGELREVVR